MLPAHKFSVRSLALVKVAIVFAVLSGCEPHKDNVGPDSRLQTTGNSFPEWQALLEDPSMDGARGQFQAPQPLAFPRDFLPHPQLRSETLTFRAILNVQPEQSMAVIVQIDRIALIADESALASPESSWAFTDLMRSLVVIDSPEEQVHQRETIQRVALGLAGVDDQRHWVNADELRILINDPCKPDFQLRAHTFDHQRVDLRWSLSACPQGQETPLFNSWSAMGFEVTGSVSRITDGGLTDKRSADGSGFFSQSFGNLPLTTGAVLFDRLQLMINGPGENGLRENGPGDERSLLSVMRSKRRSGRGPVTVVSTYGQQEYSIDSTPAAGAIEWIWADEGTRTSDVSGMTYPEIINLTDKSGKFDLVIEPLFGLTEVNDALGPRLRQAVQVSGSHDGKGFLEFQPPLPE